MHVLLVMEYMYICHTHSYILIKRILYEPIVHAHCRYDLYTMYLHNTAIVGEMIVQ